MNIYTKKSFSYGVGFDGSNYYLLDFNGNKWQVIEQLKDKDVPQAIKIELS